MSRLLISESPVLTKVRNTKSKRVLQVLQVSATDKDLLVSPNLMSGNGKKAAISLKKAEVYQDALLSKENTPVVPTVRRSKRKNVVSQEQVKKTTINEQNNGTEAKSSNKVSKVAKPKKTSRKNKKQSSVDAKQSKIDSFITSSTSNTISESNLEKNASSASNDMQLQHSKNPVEVAVTTSSIISDISLENSKDLGNAISPVMLTSDNPPDSYWKMLAEERRTALEQALRENEQLYDQIQVLETENSQLKSCLKEAEKLAEVFRQALE